MTPERRKEISKFWHQTQGKGMEEQEYPTSVPFSSGEFCKIAISAGFTQEELDDWYDQKTKKMKR